MKSLKRNLAIIKGSDTETRSPTHGLSGDDVISLRSVELGDTLDDHIITLSSATGEYDIFALSTDELCDLLYDDRRINSHISTLQIFKFAFDDESRTVRASSTAASASHPYACVRECGLPYWSVKYGSIASRTRGSTGVVACRERGYGF